MNPVEELSVIEKTMVLSKWEILRGLTTDEVALVAVHAQEVRLEQGVLDPETAAGRSIHFVLEGVIEILEDGVIVRRVGRGEVAGSLTALDGENSIETLRVSEPARTLMLSVEDFEAAVADDPDFAMALIRGLVRLVRASGGRQRAMTEEGQD